MDLIVQDVPPKVLGKLVAEARRRDVSTHEVAVSILADRYGIEREPTAAKFRQPPARSTLLLSLPDELHQRIKLDAAALKGATMRGIIIEVFAAHYRISVPSPARRKRGTVTAH